MRRWEWLLLAVAAVVLVVAAVGLVRAPAPPRASQTVVFVDAAGTPWPVRCPPAPQECQVVAR